MAISTTPNLGLPYPDGNEAVALGPQDFQNVVQGLDGGVSASANGPTAMLYTKGILASRPAANTVPIGRVYDCTDAQAAFYSDGTTWHFIPKDGGNPTIGAIEMYGGSADPVDGDGTSRWAICDGRAISRVTFVTLWNRIATTFGPGDGSTTFNIPDFRGRFPLGKATSGTGQTLGHTGGQIDHNHGSGSMTTNIGLDANNDLGLGELPGQFSFGGTYFSKASKFTIGNQLVGASGAQAVASAVTGNTDGSNPPWLSVNFIIRTL